MIHLINLIFSHQSPLYLLSFLQPFHYHQRSETSKISLALLYMATCTGGSKSSSLFNSAAMFELLGLKSLTELEKASLMFALGGFVVTTMFYLEYKWKQSRKTDRNAKQKLHLQKVRAELAELKHLRD